MSDKQQIQQLSVSIVVVSWNKKTDLVDLLDSLIKQTYPKMEIVVVDNASTDDTLQTLKKRYKNVKIVALKKNYGLHAGFNYGVSKASGDIIIGTDQDCIIRDPEVVSKVAGAFKLNPKIGILAFRVKSQFTEQDMWDNPMHLENEGAEKGFLSLTFNGAGFAVPKKICVQIGGYDEQFFIYHGEIDLTLRALDLGYQCRYFPDIAVYHKAVGHRQTTWYYRTTSRNYEWFLWKNFPSNEIIKIRILPFIWQLKKHPSTFFRLTFENLRTIYDSLPGYYKTLKKRKVLSKRTIQYFEFLRLKGKP
jgi:GT2 family glycosyltransferase